MENESKMQRGNGNNVPLSHDNGNESWWDEIYAYRKTSCVESLATLWKGQQSSFSVDEKYEMLQYAFPELSQSLVIDVLITKNYQLTQAATVLISFDNSIPPVDEEEKNCTTSEEWIIVNDEWEMINSDGQHINSYSEAVQNK